MPRAPCNAPRRPPLATCPEPPNSFLLAQVRGTADREAGATAWGHSLGGGSRRARGLRAREGGGVARARGRRGRSSSMPYGCISPWSFTYLPSNPAEFTQIQCEEPPQWRRRLRGKLLAHSQFTRSKLSGWRSSCLIHCRNRGRDFVCSYGGDGQSCAYGPSRRLRTNIDVVD